MADEQRYEKPVQQYLANPYPPESSSFVTAAGLRGSKKYSLPLPARTPSGGDEGLNPPNLALLSHTAVDGKCRGRGEGAAVLLMVREGG